jgi:hypothetical protein
LLSFDKCWQFSSAPPFVVFKKISLRIFIRNAKAFFCLSFKKSWWKHTLWDRNLSISFFKSHCAVQNCLTFQFGKKFLTTRTRSGRTQSSRSGKTGDSLGGKKCLRCSFGLHLILSVFLCKLGVFHTWL